MRLIDTLMAHPMLVERNARKVLKPMGFEVALAIDETPDEYERPDDAAAFSRDPDAYMAAIDFDVPAGFTELGRFDTENSEIIMLAVRPTTPLAHALMQHEDAAPITPTLEGAPDQASADVIAERRRQVEVEGFSRERDDQYQQAELSRAAQSYCLIASLQMRFGEVPDPNRYCDDGWPWARKWFKPSDQRRNLVKAGALILAEIERLDRAATSQGGAA